MVASVRAEVVRLKAAGNLARDSGSGLGRVLDGLTEEAG